MTRVTPEAMVDPMFVKSTVAFVAVPGVVGLGEIACREILAADVADGEGTVGAGEDVAGVGVGVGGVGVGVVGVGVDVAGAGEDVPGAGLGERAPPAMLTENDLVARPVPPCHSSKPASTSIRYHEVLM